MEFVFCRSKTKIYMKLHQLLLLSTLLLFSQILPAQSYGGEVKLKITYDDRPLVGYTITGSINDIDIGGKGVTDRNGNVTLHTDPLPIPNIDLKGVSQCGNTERKWEASGFVAIYQDQNNYFHLKLDEVARQMSEMSGLNINMIMASFGLDCDGALGSKEDGQVPHPKAGDKAQTASTSGSSTGSSSDSGGSSFGSSDKEEDDEWERKQAERKAERDADWAEWEAKNEAKREQQKKETEQFHADVMSGKKRQEGLQNQKGALENSISRIGNKIAKNEEALASSKTKEKDRFDLEWDNKELRLERKIKQNKLERTNAEIAKGQGGYLTKAEKAPYKEREEKLKDELDRVKAERKKGPSASAPAKDKAVKASSDKEGVSSDAVTGETGAAEGELSIDGTPISQMDERDLKMERLSLRSKIGKLKVKLKTKGKSMTAEEKTVLEKEIAEVQALIDAINAALEK